MDGVASAAINDRLVLPFITVRLAFQIISGAEKTLNNAREMHAPMLLFHGSSDQLTDVTATADFAQNASSSDKTIRIFEGAYHEIHNDVDRPQLFLEVNQWISERCSTQYAPSVDAVEHNYVSGILDRLSKKLRQQTIQRRFLNILIVYFFGVVLTRQRGRTIKAALTWPLRFMYLLATTL